MPNERFHFRPGYLAAIYKFCGKWSSVPYKYSLLPRARRVKRNVIFKEVMNSKIHIIFFILMLFCYENIALCGDENKISEDIGEKPYQELYRVVSNDKSVTAIWFGENPRILTESPDTSLEFGVKELIFQFSADQKKIRFEPGGELYHDGWTFDIFSKDGLYVILLQSHYGPYHVIKTENLRDYLMGKAPPFEIVKGEDPDSDGGVIHYALNWISNDTFEFSAACCGDDRIVRHKIGNKTTRSLWRNEKAFYSLVAFAVFLFVITSTGITVIIKRFKKKKNKITICW
jgi:hypothetical protein